jgi:methionine biosynthesis protein MetW
VPTEVAEAAGSVVANDSRVAKVEGYEGSRPDIRALVPPQSRRILDLGCSSGALGQALKQVRADTYVVGVEFDAGYAEEAQSRLDRVLTMDLDELPERMDLLSELGPFDCVIAADVLEHLRDPWSVLACASSLLDVGGVAIVSLPNVRHWTVIRALVLGGSWPRRPAGIFDGTHLRWFTLRDACELIESAGLHTTTVLRQYWGGRLANWRARLFGCTPVREFLAYQHVLVGRRA